MIYYSNNNIIRKVCYYINGLYSLNPIMRKFHYSHPKSNNYNKNFKPIDKFISNLYVQQIIAYFNVIIFHKSDDTVINKYNYIRHRFLTTNNK